MKPTTWFDVAKYLKHRMLCASRPLFVLPSRYPDLCDCGLGRLWTKANVEQIEEVREG